MLLEEYRVIPHRWRVLQWFVVQGLFGWLSKKKEAIPMGPKIAMHLRSMVRPKLNACGKITSFQSMSWDISNGPVSNWSWHFAKCSVVWPEALTTIRINHQQCKQVGVVMMMVLIVWTVFIAGYLVEMELD
jgi:hypothetical protein